MKKNDWILVTSALLYSYLFYQQNAGINFLVFTIALLAGLLIKKKELFISPTWKMAALGSLLSAGCLAYFGSNLALVANLISLSILSGLSMSAKSSVVFSLLFSAYSYVTSLVFMYLDWIERKQKESNLSTNGTFKKFLLVSIPVLITVLFFQLYRASNPLFAAFAAKVNFNFVSLDWIAFTLGGFVLLYGFYYHKQVTELAAFDENGQVNLTASPHEPFSLFGKEIDLNDENFSGKIMFLLLNVLLLLVNLLDFNFIFINRQLPANMTYSEFVHQGTGTVIASIVVAISIILFYFRSSLNFFAQSKTIKILAYCWIVQNVLMLVSTAFRNDLYITEYGLTYKRIGVYVYLLLAAMGLVTTFIKILKLKSNHFLFRSNGWLFYGVLIIACFVNWDVMITRYNIQVPEQIEKTYLVKLSDKTLPQLFALESNPALAKKEFVNETYVSGIEAINYDQDVPPGSYEQELSRKLFHFMHRSKNGSWQSWYYEQYNTINALKQMDDMGLIKGLDLSSTRIQTLAPLRDFKKMTKLCLNRNYISLSELSYFPNLKHLEIQNNSLRNLVGIHALSKLEYLDISVNPIDDYTPLFELKYLKTLVISKNISAAMVEKLHQQFPNLELKFS
jgi:hypothetical protein